MCSFLRRDESISHCRAHNKPPYKARTSEYLCKAVVYCSGKHTQVIYYVLGVIIVLPLDDFKLQFVYCGLDDMLCRFFAKRNMEKGSLYITKENTTKHLVNAKLYYNLICD